MLENLYPITGQTLSVANGATAFSISSIILDENDVVAGDELRDGANSIPIASVNAGLGTGTLEFAWPGTTRSGYAVWYIWRNPAVRQSAQYAAAQASKVSARQALVLNQATTWRVLTETATPWTDPEEGDGTLIATGATGAWAGKDGQIVRHMNGVDVFTAPSVGDGVNIVDAPVKKIYTGSAWEQEGATSAGSPGAPQGRLTLTAGSPVMTATVSGAATVYYAPYVGRHVPLYDGAAFVMTDILAELSNDLTASSTGKAGPAAATTNSNYDLFIWDDAGTIRLTRGPLWTSATARGTGAGTTELERVNGLWVNKVAITNGPTAQRGTYVGTIRTNGSSQVDFILSGSASGGSAASQHLWNAYNRVATAFRVFDTAASWSYTTALFRALNNSNENRIRFLNGLNEELADVTLVARIQTIASTAVMGIALGLDANNAISNLSVMGRVYASNGGAATSVTAKLNALVGLGSHYVQGLEIGDNANANSIIGGGTDECLMATVRC